MQRQNEREQLLVSLREAAKMLGVSQRTTWQLAADGRLPSIRIGSRRLFSPETLREWVKAQERGAPADAGLEADR